MSTIKLDEKDRKLVDNLLNDNVDEIRKMLNGKLLPKNVEQYMDNILKEKGINPSFAFYNDTSKPQYMFYCYYKLVMYDINGCKKDIKPYNFENAERNFVKDIMQNNNRHGISAVAISRLNPKGIDEAIARTFGKRYIYDSSAMGNTEYWFQAFKSMSLEHQDAVAKLMTEEIFEEMKTNGSDDNYMENRLLPRALKFYNGIGESEKKYMRSVLLRWRTSGNEAERRHKASLFKKVINRLKKGDNQIVKDETIKAVSGISYTKDSLLNRLNAQTAELTFEMEKDVKLQRKSERIRSMAESRENAFNEYGINIPFEWPKGSLISGCESWWYNIKYDRKNRTAHREEVQPIYKFTSKDTIDVVGAAIYKYDRIEFSSGMMLSSNRVKDREISAEEYKNLLNERRTKKNELQKHSWASKSYHD